MTSKYLYFTVFPVLIIGRRKASIDKASPTPDADSLEMKIKAVPLDLGFFLKLTPKNKGKKITTAPIEISSDEEVNAMLTPKAKNASTNHSTASTPSKTKLCVLIPSLSFLHCLISFSSVSRSYHEDQRELASIEKSYSKKLCVVSFPQSTCYFFLIHTLQ